MDYKSVLQLKSQISNTGTKDFSHLLNISKQTNFHLRKYSQNFLPWYVYARIKRHQ